MQTNNALRIALLTGLFVVPAIPFIVAGSFFFPFITGKNFTFRILVELLTGLWLILAIRDSAYRPRFSLLTYAFAIFIVVIGVADAFGMNPMRSFWSNFERMEGLVTLMHLFAYFMVLGAVFMKEALWERFLQITLLSSFVMALFSFFQLTGLYVINQGSVRVDGTLGNATYLGIYLVFHIFTALFLLFRQRTREGWSTIERAAIIFTAVAAPLILYFKIPTGATISPAHGLIFAWLIPLVAVAVIGCSFLRREYMYGGLAALFTVSLYFTATRGAILGLIGGVLISTGSKQLDYIIANKKGGGAPEGRIIEIFGPPSIGKSHLAAQFAKNTQALGGVVVYIDTENAILPENLASLGVDVSKRFIYADPECIEDVFSIVESTITKASAIKKDIPFTIIWDSLAGTPPKAELEGDYDTSTMGLAARVISKCMRKVTQVIGNHNVLFVILNQTRSKIGVMFGDPTCVDPYTTKITIKYSVED
jgi:hypothetical protein